MGYLPSSIDPPSELRSALDEWKAWRTQLATTVKSYQAACTTLHTVFKLPLGRCRGYSIFAEAIAAIDAELGSLAAEERSLLGSRMSILAARNEWVRMSVLPPEILIRIFQVSTPYCAREDRTSYQNFAGVCRYWREIAIHEPSLWNHVDIATDISEELSKMALERTNKSPIHVHIHASRSRAPAVNSEQEVARVTTILSPHVHRICSVGLLTRPPSEALIAGILDLWLKRGSPELARSLIIRRPHAMSTIPYPPQSWNGSSLCENSKLMLAALQELELQRTKIDWDSSAYRGLVNLQLSFKVDDDDLSPSIHLRQLANILSSSPLLSTLKLGTLRIEHPEDDPYPEPVRLKSLRDLSIFYIGEASLELLLRIITLPETPAELRIGLTPRDPIENALGQFLSLSGATDLYMYKWPKNPQSAFAQLSFLKSMSRLRMLVLDNYTIDNSLVIRTETVPPVPFRIPRVILLDCNVSLAGLELLTAELCIQELRIEKCQTTRNDENIRDIPIRLGEIYPEAGIVVASTDSRENWSYCSADV
ncbi:F-box-like protein [Ceratobasidium sp. AG-Ba]|nr:F-box-like protein [Ceratobasidium sp. AG-Ba]QRW09799.1 F-box-like protein [Ceratobasidium sp. AG-Ba]